MSNIIDLNAKRREKQTSKTEPETEMGTDLETLLTRYSEKKDKAAMDRNKANKCVLKSYRLKQ